MNMTDTTTSPALADDDVERVAQAIYHAEYDMDYTMEPWEERFYRDAARAAIAAMNRTRAIAAEKE